jgi:hypothetical protein
VGAHPKPARRARIPYHGIIHGGGDEVILIEFAQALRSGDDKSMLTAAAPTLKSHLICFAAEQARRTGEVVDMAAFRRAAAMDAAAL